jgi:hypothetical protein
MDGWITLFMINDLAWHGTARYEHGMGVWDGHKLHNDKYIMKKLTF